MSKRNFNVQDKFFQKAKAEGFRARSAYKLKGIQDKFKILKSGDQVLDIGAAPGSFLQFIQRVIGERGLAIGIDLQAIEPFQGENVKTFQRDVFEEGLADLLDSKYGIRQFDVITSDLAPKTSGIKSLDAGRSVELNHAVLDVAEALLKPGGHVVMKLFPGADQQTLLSRTKNLFNKVKHFKPEAVRKTSREEYVIGLGFKGQP